MSSCCLTELICFLDNHRDSSKLNFLDINRVIDVLSKINELVGLEDFKSFVCKQFKTITKRIFTRESLNSFQNIIFSGPPGVGKTQSAILYAEFLDCLLSKQDYTPGR